MEKDKELERIRFRKLKKLMDDSKKPKVKGVIALESSNFDGTLKDTDMPVLVDFWAGWCMPCIVMAPAIEELARDYAGKATFAKVNVDENPEVSQRYNIMGIPHFIIFKNGKPVERIVGAVGRGPLENALKKHLKPE
jgi:thioredoxin 1